MTPADDALEERIRRYWSARSEDFARLREFELTTEHRERWLSEIRPWLARIPAHARILDVGTGAGFFAVLLGSLEHEVTGVDLSADMIESAKRLAARHGVLADLRVMNAEELAFEDESFDLVISRNLTWTLPHPENAYGEWSRVLARGGVLLNFDADYGNVSFTCLTESLREEGVENAHERLGGMVLNECDAIKASLAVSRVRRPLWDFSVLERLGFGEIAIDRLVSERIYLERDEVWNPVPLFRIAAVKTWSKI